MSSVSEINKSVLVCLRNGCKKCKPTDSQVPKGCKFSILHALDGGIGGIREMRRRSGKTTELAKLANEIIKMRYPVYFVTLNSNISSNTENCHHMPGVKMIPLTVMQNGLGRGFAPGYILCDELEPEQVEWVMNEMIGCQLVAAYYSSH